MSFFNRFRRSPETRHASIENPTVPVSSENFLAFFGVQSANLPTVTVESALTVPAVAAAVSFLSSSLANLPLHVFKDRGEAGVERAGGDDQRILNEALNEEWSSYAGRKYFWSQVFTVGRGLFWIDRRGRKMTALWPMNAATTVVQRVQGKRVYRCEGKTYSADEVIDVPFLLCADQLSVRSPISMGSKAIAASLAMMGYGANFFAGGGVPPLALTGPMPSGAEAVARAQADINRAIEAASSGNQPIFPVPSGYTLTAVGFDPAKGQMVEGRRFQTEEHARSFGLPPVFLQDLTHGTFTNTEQQDLFLAKHLISQWAKALEDEVNLKVYGARRNKVYAEHSLDGLMRGALKDRLEALARGVNSALLTPDEARALDNRGKQPGGDKLYMQGATVPLGTDPANTKNKGGADDPGDPDTQPEG